MFKNEVLLTQAERWAKLRAGNGSDDPAVILGEIAQNATSVSEISMVLEHPDCDNIVRNVALEVHAKLTGSY